MVHNDSQMKAEASIQSMNQSTLKHITTPGDDHVIEDILKMEDAFLLKTYSSLGDCARLFAHARQYRGSDSKQNKQISLTHPIEYKWPYGSATTIANPNQPIDATPTQYRRDENILVDGLFDEEDKAIQMSYGTYGPFILKNKEVGKYVLMGDSRIKDTERRAGHGIPFHAEKRLCPASIEEITNAEYGGDYIIGCAINTSEVFGAYCDHYYKGSVTALDLQNLASAGILWAKVRLQNVVSSGGDKVGAVCVDMLVASSNDVGKINGMHTLGIDPAFFLCGNYNNLINISTDGENVSASSKYELPLGMSYDNSTSTIKGYGNFLKKNNLEPTSFESGPSSYNSTILKENVARVRFFIKDGDRETANTVTKKTLPNDLFNKGANLTYITLSKEVLSTDALVPVGNGSVLMVEACKRIANYAINEKSRGVHMCYTQGARQNFVAISDPDVPVHFHPKQCTCEKCSKSGIGTDCSALVTWALLESGVLPKTEMKGWWLDSSSLVDSWKNLSNRLDPNYELRVVTQKGGGKKIDTSLIRPGDICAITGHAWVYLDSGQRLDWGSHNYSQPVKGGGFSYFNESRAVRAIVLRVCEKNDSNGISLA